jgi:archaellum component FlaC
MSEFAAPSNAELYDGLMDLKRAIDWYSMKLDEQFAKTDDRFAKIDDRFAKMDDRFAKIDDRFAKMDDRFAKMDDRFAKMDMNFASIERRFDQERELTARRFDRLDQNVDLLTGMVARIEAKLG